MRAILARKVCMHADDLEAEVNLAAQEGSESAEKTTGKPVKWANPILQKRAWSDAWLALLALPLPEAILRKVRAGMNHLSGLCHRMMHNLSLKSQGV